MIISLLKFFISPTNSVDKVKWISTNYKFVIILTSILISTVISTVFTLFWILPFWFDVISYLITVLFAIVFNFIFAGIIYWVGTHLKNKIQGSFIDNLLFIVLSSLIFGFSPIIFYLMSQNWLFTWSFLWTLFFLGWALILMSKSLAKLNTISEGKVTLLVVISLVIIYAIDYILPFSILWTNSVNLNSIPETSYDYQNIDSWDTIFNTDDNISTVTQEEIKTDFDLIWKWTGSYILDWIEETKFSLNLTWKDTIDVPWYITLEWTSSEAMKTQEWWIQILKSELDGFVTEWKIFLQKKYITENDIFENVTLIGDIKKEGNEVNWILEFLNGTWSFIMVK